MPFQDVDEVETPDVERPPSRVAKLARKIFLEDWSLKLLSLAIALVLWLVVTGQNEPVTAHVNVQLNFIRPQALEISNDPPRTVDVMLTGSRNKLDDLTALDLVATVDLSDQQPGERVLRLADKAQISLPQGVKVDGFQPSAIPIRLESIVERQIPIEAKVEGKPADGYQVYAVRPSKGSVLVRGPESRVNALQKVMTETIWLSGHKETFTANLNIDVPDTKIDLLDPVVTVEVDIAESPVERTFSGVKLANVVSGEAPTWTVTVSGPPSMLDKLKPEDLQIGFSPVGISSQMERKLLVPPQYEGKVTLKSIKDSETSTKDFLERRY
ncbi:MAG TPA: CdaR family protein [Pyrinomonadaceae bacterium]|nr:CdaR family protein [Pyrinomonadaceae bacterium]